MVEDNKFNQYGYSHYLKAPAKPSPNARHSVESSISFAPSIMNKLKTPLVAIVLLGGIVALFAGIVIATYPSSDEIPRNIPIIKADLRPIKSDPVQRGGMSVANTQSTVMAGIDDVRSVENILLRFSGDPVDMINKEEALNKAMAQSPVSLPDSSMPRVDLVEGTLDDNISGSNMLDEIVVDITEQSSENAKDILQKIGSSAAAISNEAGGEFDQKVAAAAVLDKPKFGRRAIYAAASAPDTLDFVRKILDEKALGASSIEPAVGAASPASNVTAAMYFVQLASITDPARAGAEWVKMQNKYSVLSQSKFRVQEASLPSGNFYRIQAGPMSKSEADDMCNSLKAQNKSGGCLVVK